MNIIKTVLDKNGSTWGVMALNNRFMIVVKAVDPQNWILTGEEYADPDPAIKSLKRREA